MLASTPIPSLGDRTGRKTTDSAAKAGKLHVPLLGTDMPILEGDV